MLLRQMVFRYVLLWILITGLSLKGFNQDNSSSDPSSSLSPSSSSPKDSLSPNLNWLILGNNEYSFDVYRSLLSLGKHHFIVPAYALTQLQITLLAAASRVSVTYLQEVAKIQVLPPELFHLNHTLYTSYGQDYGLLLKGIGGHHRFWVKLGTPIHPNWLTTSKQYLPFSEVSIEKFETGPEELAETINHWGSILSNGLISNLYNQETMGKRRTHFFMTSLSYLSVPWYYQMAPSSVPLKYNIPKTEIRSLAWPCLEQELKVRLLRGTNLLLIEFLLKPERLRLLVFLPNDLEVLNKLEQSMQTYRLYDWLDKLKEARAFIRFPVFTTSTSIDLWDIFRILNPVFFNKKEKCEFSNIFRNEPLPLGIIEHRSFIQFQAGGDVPPAKGLYSDKIQGPYNISLDRPFMYIIYDEPTKMIFFIGRFCP